MDDYSNSPSFEVIEEIKVNHGMFVSTRQVAETFFHQIVPSETVKVHLNPAMMKNLSIDHQKSDVQIRSTSENNIRSSSFFRKFKYVASALLSMVALVLVHLYVGGYLEEEEDGFTASTAGKVKGKGCCPNNMKNKRRSERKKQDSLVINTQGGGNYSLSTAFSRSVGIFLTLSLALCTMWANHIIPTA
jgi:hypothetical protein